MKQGYLKSLQTCVKAYWHDESGATAIEYGLIAALIGVGIIGGLRAFGNQTDGAWVGMSDTIANAL